MWLYLVAGVPFFILLLYFAMKNGFLTFGIGGLKQARDHSSKEWKTERAIVPISNFKVETDVKWCPNTDEIYYRTPEETSMFEKEWKEVSEYSDLYAKLLSNFNRKYKQSGIEQNNRTNWTQASKQNQTYDQRRRT